MVFQHPAEKSDDGERGRFEQFAELASNFTSSALFSVLCLALVLTFVGVYVGGAGTEWQHVVGDSMGAVTLLLLALLKNSERRAEHALQRKLDAIAMALLEEREAGKGTDEAREELRAAIRVEERH